MLQVGVLGCGPIAQATHFDSCNKASNAQLYALCDKAADLRERMAARYAPVKSYADYDDMLADPALDAVIVATADAFHVAASVRALTAGKHVLCEKPMAVTVEESETLATAVATSGKVFQVGHMKRFDAGLQEAKKFIATEMGDIIACKAWYCDSTHRYAMTDATQPQIITSPQAHRPTQNPKDDLARYYMLAHGSHLVDTARFLVGEIVAVQARLSAAKGAYCWFVDVEFANGCLGHLDLMVAVRMDWHEGFEVHGANGSVIGKIHNPWFYKTSTVEIFHEATAMTQRPLGADGHFFRRQLEAFAAACNGDPQTGATVDDGVASIRALAAIAQSVASGTRVPLSAATGGP